MVGKCNQLSPIAEIIEYITAPDMADKCLPCAVKQTEAEGKWLDEFIAEGEKLMLRPFHEFTAEELIILDTDHTRPGSAFTRRL